MHRLKRYWHSSSLLLRSQLYLWGQPLFFFFCVPSFIPGVHHFRGDNCTCDHFLIQPLRQSHSIFMDGACWVCFYCWHSPVQDMNVRIFWVPVVECRLDLGLYSHPKEIWGNGARNHVNSKEKIPSTGGSEEIWTCDAASHRSESPTRYELSYYGPKKQQTQHTCSIQKTIRSINSSPITGAHTLQPTKKQNHSTAYYHSSCCLQDPASTLCVFVCVCIIISLYGWGYLCVRWYGIWVLWVIFISLFSWMLQHDCLDTCCFECLIYICFLFSGIEHVSHGSTHIITIIIMHYLMLTPELFTGMTQNHCRKWHKLFFFKRYLSMSNNDDDGAFLQHLPW